MSRAPKGAQRAVGHYRKSDGSFFCAADIEMDPRRNHFTPVLVIPEQALKDCAKAGHPNHWFLEAHGGVLRVCADCGSMKVCDGPWVKPTLLRVARRKR